MNRNMCTCVHVCMHTCVRIHVYRHMCMYPTICNCRSVCGFTVYTYACTCIWTAYIHTYIWVICMYAYFYALKRCYMWSGSLFAIVCMHVYIVCTYINTHTHTHTYIHTRQSVGTQLDTRMHVFLNSHTHIYAYVPEFSYAHTFMHTYIHTRQSVGT